MEIASILKHVGIIKNELLVFGVLGQVVTHGFAAFLDKSAIQFQQYAGAGLHLCGAGMFVLIGGFYFFALLKLPGSAQELKFEKSAQEALKVHSRALHRRGKKAKTSE
jgi:hypothetical protein